MQVRGTPASGKTTLAALFYGHIIRQEENTNVIFIERWPPDVADTHVQRLQSLGWEPSINTVFIFDNAEATYSDSGLWLDLFKYMHDYSNRRAIVFTRYGSPDSRIFLEDFATPIQLKPAQRVNLHPIFHDDGLPSVGLFLTWDEFNDFIHRYYPSPQHNFHPKFLDEVYKLTVGHVGALMDFMSVITAHDVGLCYVNRTVNLTCLLVISGSQVRQWRIHLGPIFGKRWFRLFNNQT